MMGGLLCFVLLLAASDESWQQRAYEEGQAPTVVQEMLAANSLTIDQLSLLAYLQSCLGEFDDSIQTLERVLEQRPNDTQFMTRIANNHWYSGRYASADRVFAQIQGEVKDNPAALASLQQTRATLSELRNESTQLQSSLFRIRMGFAAAVTITLIVIIIGARFVLRP